MDADEARAKFRKESYDKFIKNFYMPKDVPRDIVIKKVFERGFSMGWKRGRKRAIREDFSYLLGKRDR